MNNYIKNARAMGMSEAEIKESLLKASWSEKDIDMAMQGGLVPPRPGSTSIPGPIDLLIKAFDIYRQRKGVVLKIIGLFAIWTAVIVGLSIKGGDSIWVVGVLLVLAVAFNIAWFMATGALIKMADTSIPLTFGEAMREGARKFWSMVLISILGVLVIMGGFILLIIPGIIFALYLVFPNYVLFHEGLRGREALMRSRQLVKGNWWKVFWRVVFIMVVGAMVGMLVALAIMPLGLSEEAARDLMNNIIYLLVTPVAVFYIFSLCRHLSALKPPVPESVSKLNKYMVIGIIGMIIVPILFVVSFSLRGARVVGRDTRRLSDARQIQLALDLYEYKNGRYPEKLDNLVPEQLASIPKDIDTNQPYEYTMRGSDDYVFCVKFESKPEKVCGSKETEIGNFR